MGFQTNRFTFEKFPPPPPLLHPEISLEYDFHEIKTFPHKKIEMAV